MRDDHESRGARSGLTLLDSKAVQPETRKPVECSFAVQALCPALDPVLQTIGVDGAGGPMGVRTKDAIRSQHDGNFNPTARIRDRHPEIFATPSTTVKTIVTSPPQRERREAEEEREDGQDRERSPAEDCEGTMSHEHSIVSPHSARSSP